ncbi:MAG: undecaprenyl-diphosphate phosphatase [Clostridia bacterium]|nr:undecaprenyl-diphosphate phosphatase [Clostridia bacterium]
MNVLEALLLGIIQGITEFLPVSSSGHMSLFTHFAGIESQTAGLFSAMLHIGTLVAILVVFYKPIYELFTEFLLVFKDIFAKSFTFNFNKMSNTRRMLFMFVFSCVPLLVLLIPVGGGKNIMDLVGVFGSDDSIKAEGICFMFTGFLLLLGTFTAEKTRKFHQITTSNAFLIGVAQLFAACFPGISRSGSTISTAMCCRISRKDAVRYSFILSIPAVLASGLVEVKDALELSEYIPIPALLVGVVTSAVVGVFGIKLLEILVKKNLFKYFGFYCLGLGFIVSIIGTIEAFIK